MRISARVLERSLSFMLIDDAGDAILEMLFVEVDQKSEFKREE